MTGRQVSIAYRRNRGDIQSIREVFMDEAYRLPNGLSPKTLVDLGGNIGLTSLWYSTNYPIEQLVVLEPVPANAQLARGNLAHLPFATVLEAAVSSKSGPRQFGGDLGRSNLGRLLPNTDVGELTVATMTMNEVLDHIASTNVDLLKIDIEGGEEAILTEGDLAWLRRVEAIIIELHPSMVDYPKCVHIIKSEGFDYYAANSLWQGQMDLFVRPLDSGKLRVRA